ncbi:pyocin activator PrtN family protein [Photobacterium leiognathi]|uniref:pyocin activator PrtN family protein n=1 Tax=Photobacterium leiognathi TaxID=553611 RepID=UPI002982A958|nr:pyocin activator PrtN family protein [Photobacterium leiognathi]
MRNQTTLAALLVKYDNQILVPIVRLSNSQKAPLLIHLEDLARFIELQRSRAKYQ